MTSAKEGLSSSKESTPSISLLTVGLKELCGLQTCIDKKDKDSERPDGILKVLSQPEIALHSFLFPRNGSSRTLEAALGFVSTSMKQDVLEAVRKAVFYGTPLPDHFPISLIPNPLERSEAFKYTHPFKDIGIFFKSMADEQRAKQLQADRIRAWIVKKLLSILGLPSAEIKFEPRVRLEEPLNMAFLEEDSGVRWIPRI